MRADMELLSISDDKGRRLVYKYSPALIEEEAPLVVILHGHTYNATPSKYKKDTLNVLAPIDNFGVENSGSWWLGEDGDYFVKNLLHRLIREKLSQTNGHLYFWGSSMGGFGAILHGILLGANAVYANVPQIKLLNSTYSETGMRKFFKPIFGDDNRSIYNDLTKVLEWKVLSDKSKVPLFLVAQSRYDYKKYLFEQSLYFFNKCLELDVNIGYEVFPKKGHALMVPAHDAIDKMLRLYNETRESEVKKMKHIVFGIMNFSVLYSKTNAFKASRKDYENYKKTILNPERLAMREQIFFDYTVPLILRKSKEYKEVGIVFIFNVAVSDQLPSHLIEKSDSLECKYGDVFNVVKVPESSPHNWMEVLELELLELGSEYSFLNEEVVFLNFRLDDDDVLSPDYFKAIINYLDPIYEGFYLTFPKGFVGVYDEGFKDFYEINKPYLAIGLSKVCKYNIKKREIITSAPVVNLISHTSIVKNSKTILDSTFYSYIWTMHRFSDTRSNDISYVSSSNNIQAFIKDNNLPCFDFKDVEVLFQQSF